MLVTPSVERIVEKPQRKPHGFVSKVGWMKSNNKVEDLL